MVYNTFDKKTVGGAVENKIIQIKELTEELFTNQLLQNLKNEKGTHLYR